MKLADVSLDLYYAVEIKSGIRPTSGYIQIPNVSKLAEFNYEEGLPTLLELEAIYTNELMILWKNAIETYKAAAVKNLGIWFCVSIAKRHNLFFKGKPLPVQGRNFIDGINRWRVKIPIVPLSVVEKETVR